MTKATDVVLFFGSIFGFVSLLTTTPDYLPNIKLLFGILLIFISLKMALER